MDEIVRPHLYVDAGRFEVMLKRRGLTQKALAQQLDMHENTLVRIKKEGVTQLPTLAALCEALDCHPFDLLVATGFQSPFYLAPASL